MNLRSILLLIITSICSISTIAASEPHVSVNNRVLAKINGTPITTVDVVKQMDLFYLRHVPEEEKSPHTLYQFYSANWQRFLNDLIDRQLIIADAKEKKMEIADGDIRQELEENFGPNVAKTIEKLGMTYKEVWQNVKEDIILRRMMIYMVNSKAFNKVSPAEIRKAYNYYKEQALKNDNWNYYVITIKDKNDNDSKDIAQKAYSMLSEGQASLKTVQEKLKKASILNKNSKVTVSKEFSHNTTTLSKSYHSILKELKAGEYSQPIYNKSRDNTIAYRIFYLENYHSPKVSSLPEIEDNLKERIIDRIASQEARKYLNKLRKHFHVDEQQIATMIPENYEPFSII